MSLNIDLLSKAMDTIGRTIPQNIVPRGNISEYGSTA
jgi:hypothetical protein